MTTKKKLLEAYDNERFGPLLGVSDEGSAAPTIAAAAYKAAKARAVDTADEMVVGMIIDGERMGSAGEVPIGPPEYKDLLSAANGRTFATTNVGVRVNTRLHQPLPEFLVADAATNEQAWLDEIFEAFVPFIDTPDKQPRPLTIRLRTRDKACLAALRDLVPKLENGRQNGRLGPPALHRLSFLIDFNRQIISDDFDEIRKLMKLAAELKVPEVAVDGKLLEAARRRISIQGLLNVLEPQPARVLLADAKELGVDLVYHFEVDQETAARTVWTGLNSAHLNGLTAAKYGLFPLKLDQQNYVVKNIQAWIAADWTPIPAFYVDTPLVTRYDILENDRIVESAQMWMDMIASHGAKVALIDSPDRIEKHRLLRSTGGPDDSGVLTLDQVDVLTRHAEGLGLKVFWSGGIKPDQAFELGKLGVAGIFTTGSTARRAAVHGTMLDDQRLAAQAEPTDNGVRKIHALVGAGYLCRVIDQNDIASDIEAGVKNLLDSGTTGEAAKKALDSLNEALTRGWNEHWG